MLKPQDRPPDAARLALSRYAAGSLVTALWSGDGRYYDAVVQSVAAPFVEVLYVGWETDGPLQVQSRDVRPRGAIWTEEVDAISGWKYYFNGSSGESSWTRPSDTEFIVPAREPPPTPSTSLSTPRASSGKSLFQASQVVHSSGASLVAPLRRQSFRNVPSLAVSSAAQLPSSSFLPPVPVGSTNSKARAMAAKEDDGAAAIKRMMSKGGFTGRCGGCGGC